MKGTYIPGGLKKFRRTPWRFQQTIERPDPSDLARFISFIAEQHPSMTSGSIIIDKIIFDTVRLSAFCDEGCILAHDYALEGESAEEWKELLVAALLDGIDFVFIPAPKPFVFYSAQEDWISFFANIKSNLNGVIDPLVDAGFKRVVNWQREF